MPLLVWLLFTRISRAYVNPPSAQHLSTHTHTLSVTHTHTHVDVYAHKRLA